MNLSRFPVRTIQSAGRSSRGHDAFSPSPVPSLESRHLAHDTLVPTRSGTHAPGLTSISGAAAAASDAFARGVEEELTRLHDENTKYKVANAELQGRIDGIEYVPNLSHNIRAIHNVFRNIRNDLLEELCAKIDATRAKVHNIAERVSTMDDQAGGITADLKQEDYLYVRYWRSEPYQDLRSATGPKSTSTPTLCIYMERDDGQLVDSEVQDDILADARGFWADAL